MSLRSTISSLAMIAVLMGGLSFAAPASAADMPTGTMKHEQFSPEKMQQKIDERITRLHKDLGITAAQEDMWKTVAQTMRDNGSAMAALIEARHSQKAQSAIEQLESYQKVAQAHADGISKTSDAFKPLYDSMSDAQKATADKVFSQFHEHRGHHKGAMATKPAAETGTKAAK